MQREMAARRGIGASGSCLVQAPGAGLIVGRAVGDLAALVAHRSQRRTVPHAGEEFILGVGVDAGGGRDLGGLRLRQLTRSERALRRWEFLESLRGVKFARRLT